MTLPKPASVSVGETFSRCHVFNQMEVRAFATAAGDTNPLHHDSGIAARSRYGGLIVSGTHTTALLLGLAAAHFSRSFSVVGTAFSVEFRRAVAADATVQIGWEVAAVTVARKAVQRVELRGGVYGQGGEVCVSATGMVRLSAPA
ncbi:dehydratase [Massilia sp. Root351]|jgi:acyl dehydratase|uniref:MaoC family dehydratase n=1 Tax=Massilia sp. Root351 TaxID=1736522 RepID=UPI00070B7EFA|nr:MaoC family dehydratase [Massilia sp. Root351]KQV83336.1 dehydratase [Massilia sp. Root351]